MKIDEFPITKDALCQVLNEIGSVVFERILKSSMKFYYVAIIISPWKIAWPFIWTNLNYALCPVWLIELGLCMAIDNGKIMIRKAAWTWAFGWEK